LMIQKRRLPTGENDFYLGKMPDVLAPVAKIKPIRNRRKGISLGVVAGYYQTTEKITGDISRGFVNPPNSNFIARHQDRSITGKTWTSGLNLNIDLGKNWSLTPGVIYRKDIFNSTQSTSAKFKNFSHGPMDRLHKSTFLQNTTRGVAGIDIRIESTDGSIIDGDEKVKITTQLTREETYLSLPVALNYNVDQGNWHFNFGGGLLFNIAAGKKKFDVDVIDVEHPRFKRETVSKERKPTRAAKQKTNLDGIFNLGIEYDVTDRIGLAFSPSVIFDLTESIEIPKIDTDMFSIGANLGVNYNF